MKSKDLNKRIEALMWHLRLSQNKFADTVGISSVTMSRIVRGSSVPGGETINAILTAFPEVNPTWLMTGSGEMTIEKTESTQLSNPVELTEGNC